MVQEFKGNLVKFSGNFNNIDDPCAKLCVPDVVKNNNVKLFNLLSKTIETKNIKLNETCKCKCRLDRSVIINNVRIMINVDANIRNFLIMKVVVKDLFGNLVIVNVNVKHYVMLESI